MGRKLRNKAKNKKGFTLVELIVVIVIILVLAAVMVPNLLKYIETANKANCKSDAATILAQLQADYAAGQATTETGMPPLDANYTVNGIPVKAGNAAPTAKGAVYEVVGDEIVKFIYYDGKEYTATWQQKGTDAGWEITP